jgi:hypothetical protein
MVSFLYNIQMNKWIEKFWSRVAKTNNENDCWNWVGASNNIGYGRFHNGKKLVYPHRYSYELKYGDIPFGMLVCHSCDNPSCVNPNHLWIGSHKDNSQDMINKKRGRNGRRGGKGNEKYYKFKIILQGEIHPLSKLTDKKVKEIKIRLKNGERNIDLAKEYKVSATLIWMIKKGISWKHVN